MTSEEAIIHLSEWMDEKMWRCFGTIDREAIDMAIEALQTLEAVERIKTEVLPQTDLVRCKDCKNWRESHSEDDESYCYIDGRTTDSTDYCSWGELADKTKYPATYNTNTKCGGCVHLDELGRCLNFMLAKDDRSCWRGSW